MNESAPQVIGLILAAGRSRRFADDKRRALLPDGRSMLQASIDTARQSFNELWVVLRSDDDAQALGIVPDVCIVRSEQADLGMGHSLASGIEALMPSPAIAVAVLLADMPWLQAATLRSLVQLADSQRIAQPIYEGQRGHPVIIGRRFWPELLLLEGDQGARTLLAANSSACDLMATDDPGTVRDVDTPEQILLGLSGPR
ncbi:nucleotidyltransferase family protein [Pseudomonas capsici]|uniref:nucleotidyltransferase family protein n=1 Tax=Pseudomonas capsici TaxID=2810614 RepID=UPI0021F0D0AE|nr:nucleotidyltransferase family protein [Pseudomonas capsici]MCV4282242.1 nucleotidyltransferase family protein [Pseudomonas capsici]